MKVHDKWNLCLAVLAILPATMGMMDLYKSRDFSQDWGGPLWVFVCLASLYQAFRKPKAVVAR